MTKNIKPLKYECVSQETITSIANIYKDYRVAEHIQDLYNLIDHQMRELHKKRSEDIAIKHQDAWKQYDKN